MKKFCSLRKSILIISFLLLQFTLSCDYDSNTNSSSSDKGDYRFIFKNDSGYRALIFYYSVSENDNYETVAAQEYRSYLPGASIELDARVLTSDRLFTVFCNNKILIYKIDPAAAANLQVIQLQPGDVL